MLEAISSNDVRTFLGLVGENEGILEQKTACLNSVLHLASKFGHIDIVLEITKLCPEMVAAENEELETPVHEACRQGNPNVLRLLLEANPRAVFKLNSYKQSGLFLASSLGHLDALTFLMKQPGILDFEEDVGPDHTFIHVAASRGYTGRFGLE